MAKCRLEKDAKSDGSGTACDPNSTAHESETIELT